MSVVDNLNKGPPAAAVQWMNRMLGFDETAGLKRCGWVDVMSAAPRPSPSPLPPSGRGIVASHLRPVFAQYPIEVVSADGVYLAHSRTAASPLTCTAVSPWRRSANGHPRWLKALNDQARKVLFQTNAVAMEVVSAPQAGSSNSAVSASIRFLRQQRRGGRTRTHSRWRSRSRPLAGRRGRGGFHGRTAAAGAITWGAKEKWSAFRARRSRQFHCARHLAAIEEQVTKRQAAVIVEPVQGLPGRDLGKEFLRPAGALRWSRRRPDFR